MEAIMCQKIRWASRALVAALFLAPVPAIAGQGSVMPMARTTTHAPDQFGTDIYTVTVIPAVSFTADKDTATPYGSLYRYFGEDTNEFGIGTIYSGHLNVGVNLPAGAIIDFIGMQSYDYYGGNNQATLFYLDQHSGTTSGIVSLSSTAHANGEASDYNETPLSWQLIKNAHNALVLDVYIPGGEDYPHRGILGWIEIWWRRSVSPASPFPAFYDVGESDPGYQYVEALAASGITAGCAPNYFCPDQPLTRRQMAIFLARALGLHWPY
jgi:hypothetical protein